MKDFSITLKIKNPQDLDISRNHYSKTAAKIIINKIPNSLLNTFIKEIETKEVMDDDSLKWIQFYEQSRKEYKA